MLAAALFFSCDIKRKNKIVDDAAIAFNAALKDTTTVQVIDSFFNFDTAVEGDKVEREYRFVNTGKKPLVITQANASCGCTVAEKPETPILPGDTSFIRVVFNSEGRFGHNEKTIRVESNAYPPFPNLKLVGRVVLKQKSN